MSKQYRFASVFAVSVLMAGCGGEEQARQYAAQLSAILTHYQTNVDKHIGAQNQTYDQLARELDDAALRDGQRSLETDRERRAFELSDQLISSASDEFNGFTRTKLRAALDTYAQNEFDRNRELVTRDLDSYRRFLTGLQDLEQQVADVSKLQKQFNDLSKKSSSVDQIKQLAAFGQDIKDKYGKLLCDGSKSEQTDLSDNIAALDSKLKDTATSDSAKPGLQAEMKRAQDALKQVNDRLAGCK